MRIGAVNFDRTQNTHLATRSNDFRNYIPRARRNNFLQMWHSQSSFRAALRLSPVTFSPLIPQPRGTKGLASRPLPSLDSDGEGNIETQRRSRHTPPLNSPVYNLVPVPVLRARIEREGKERIRGTRYFYNINTQCTLIRHAAFPWNVLSPPPSLPPSTPYRVTSAAIFNRVQRIYISDLKIYPSNFPPLLLPKSEPYNYFR